MESLGNNPSWTRSLVALACAALVLGPSLSRAAVALPIIQPSEVPSTSPQIPSVATRAITATLSADAMFAFASSVLSPAGRESLANLFNSLGGTNQIIHLSVVGHSDPIGGATYNERLSEERANAVKSFFAEAGVPNSSIDASGVGDTSPVTRSCSRAQTAEAIKCHGPDRRVELRAIVRTSTPPITASSANTGFIDLRSPTTTPEVADTEKLESAADRAGPTVEAAKLVTPPVLTTALALKSPNSTQTSVQLSTDSKQVATINKPASPAHLPRAEPANSTSPESAPVAAPVVIQDKLEQCELKAGLPLEDQIVGCANKAHWSVLWNIPGNWTAPNDATYTGNFEQVATQFFDQMAENGADIWVDVWEGNNTIIVTPTGAQGVEQ
jgi:outer membrane protein OmpA-like peptidoglycan-associated protein